MARQYAAIMASLGMTLVLMRALRNGGAFEAAVVSAMVWMATLGAIGYVAATIARSVIDESVRQRLEDELANQPTATPTNSPS